jgi:CRISPR-associated protein Cmr6
MHLLKYLIGIFYVTFFDAMYIPISKKHEYALHADVLTVHHKNYYQRGDAAPADWDSPTPIPFLSATGSYLIALGGPRTWAEVALQILGEALYEMGVGAKTSSGYGRLDVPVIRMLRQLDSLENRKVVQKIKWYCNQVEDPTKSAVFRKLVGQAIVNKVEEAGKTAQLSKKEWYQNLLLVLAKLEEMV